MVDETVQTAAIVGGAAATGVTVGAVTAPTIATTAVGLLGFTANGIAASSTAATMMSSAAIANGGGVAAGGLVATLQSIGVIGLGSALMPVVVTGAIIGGVTVAGGAGVYYGTKYYLNRSKL